MVSDSSCAAGGISGGPRDYRPMVPPVSTVSIPRGGRVYLSGLPLPGWAGSGDSVSVALVSPFQGSPRLMKVGQTMRIGASLPTEFMDGVIDDVQIWAEALDAGQIRALHGQP